MPVLDKAVEPAEAHALLLWWCRCCSGAIDCACTTCVPALGVHSQLGQELGSSSSKLNTSTHIQDVCPVQQLGEMDEGLGRDTAQGIGVRKAEE